MHQNTGVINGTDAFLLYAMLMLKFNQLSRHSHNLLLRLLMVWTGLLKSYGRIFNCRHVIELLEGTSEQEAVD